MCILTYMKIDLGLEIPSIKRNNRLKNRLLYLCSFPPATQRLDLELQKLQMSCHSTLEGSKVVIIKQYECCMLVLVDLYSKFFKFGSIFSNDQNSHWFVL